MKHAISVLFLVVLTTGIVHAGSITKVNSGSSLDGSIDASAGGKTITVNAGGGADMLIVGTSTEFGAGSTFTATYDGNPMTWATGNKSQSNLFYLDLTKTSYSGGNAPLAFSWNYTAGGDLGVGWVSVNGNLQPKESITLHNTGSSGGSTSVNLTTTKAGTFNFVNFNGNKGNNGSAPQAPLTEIYSDGSFGSNAGAAGYEADVDAGAHTYSWNHNNPRRNDAAAFSILSQVHLDLGTNNPDDITIDPGDELAFKIDADYLIVAGGGGGGSRYYSRTGGGGGAGGLLSGTTTIAGAQSITVGAGGAGGLGKYGQGGKGGDSSISGIDTATGGGGGGRNGSNGSNGGSGGGGSGHSSTNSGGTGIAGQGFAGGGNDTSQRGNAGGGGGAGGAGQTTSEGSAGGPGVASSITGTPVTYASGGDGGILVSGAGPGASGAANTGDGGEGGYSDDVNGNSGYGGDGGSGIVVVRYNSYTGDQVLTGGDSIGQVGGDWVHQFTSVGTSALNFISDPSATVAGNITGSGDLVWESGGALNLAGDIDSFTGGITIAKAAGTVKYSGSTDLQLDNQLSGPGTFEHAGPGTVMVTSDNSGFAGAVDVNVGAFGAAGPGASVGGDVVFAPGTDIYFDGVNALTVGGTVSFEGALGVADVVGLSAPLGIGTYRIFDGDVDGTNLLNTTELTADYLSTGEMAYFQVGSLDLVIIPIPEPSSLILAGLALTVICMRRGLK